MAEINFFQGQTDLLFDIKESSDNKDKSELQIQEIQKRIVEFFNVKNIHFLFGSGTSCNAIPNMKGLSDAAKKGIELIGGEVQEEFEAIINRIENKENLEEILGILYSNKIYLDNY